MQHKYYMGKSFSKATITTYTISVTVFILGAIFYSIYFTSVSPTTWTIVFTVLGVLVLLLERHFFHIARESIYYQITDQGLVYHGFGNVENCYAWKDFTEVYTERFVYDSLCNVRFVCGGKTIIINKYIDDPCELAYKIIYRVKPHVDVDQEITKRMKTLSGIHI